MNEKREAALRWLRSARTAKDVFSELAKYLVPGKQNVRESPCVISEEYHDEFNLVDIMDHLLALIANDKKKYTKELVILDGLLGISLINAWVMKQEADARRTPTAQLHASAKQHRGDGRRLEPDVKNCRAPLRDFAAAVLDQWADRLENRSYGQHRSQ